MELNLGRGITKSLPTENAAVQGGRVGGCGFAWVIGAKGWMLGLKHLVANI